MKYVSCVGEHVVTSDWTAVYSEISAAAQAIARQIVDNAITHFIITFLLVQVFVEYYITHSFPLQAANADFVGGFDEHQFRYAALPCFGTGSAKGRVETIPTRARVVVVVGFFYFFPFASFRFFFFFCKIHGLHSVLPETQKRVSGCFRFELSKIEDYSTDSANETGGGGWGCEGWLYF